MEVPFLLIFTTCIVNFEFTSVQAYNQTAEQFQNLFNSIAKKNTNESVIYHEILKQEAIREQQIFDALKEDLQGAKNRNAYNKKNFYERSNLNENIIAFKREIEENNNDSSAFSFEQLEDDSMKVRFREVGQDLINLNVDSFMEKSVNTFEVMCKSFVFSNYLGYRNIYNDMLTATFCPRNQRFAKLYRGNNSGLVATSKVTTFLLEFVVNKSSAYAMAEIEKYIDNFYGEKIDILGIGINFYYLQAPTGATVVDKLMTDKIKCDWEGRLYSESGELKKNFTHKEKVLECP